MNTENDYFVEYFTSAQSEALTPRESAIVDLRFGFMGGSPHTLEAIGQEFGVTRERIRQILNKALRKIVAKGKRELKGGKLNAPCAALLTYVEGAIRPSDEGAVCRIVDFVEADLSYLPKNSSLLLIAYLAFQNRKIAAAKISEVPKLVRDRKIAQGRYYKNQAKLQDLLANVIWPNKIVMMTSESIEGLERARHVSSDSEGNAGSFHSGKMARLIEYESEIELRFYQWLEELDEVKFYQEQPFKVPYEYEGRRFLYYPDVLFVLEDGKGIVVEIKPIFKMALNINLKKWTGLRNFCSDKGLGLLVTDGRYTIQQIQHYEVNPSFAKDVLMLLDKGPLSWAQYKPIREKHNATRNDFVGLVLKSKLYWSLNPFKLCAV